MSVIVSNLRLVIIIVSECCRVGLGYELAGRHPDVIPLQT